jgi:hypothetical protein
MENKQFTVEQYKEAKEVAKQFGINPVGKSKQTLVDLVNEKLAAGENPENFIQQKTETPKLKWYEENPVGVKVGDIIQIISKTINKDGIEKEILQGRYATVIGFSSKKGLVRAYLLHEKTGQRLNCPITLEVGKFNKVADDWKFEDTLKTEEVNNESSEPIENNEQVEEQNIEDQVTNNEQQDVSENQLNDEISNEPVSENEENKLDEAI